MEKSILASVLLLGAFAAQAVTVTDDFNRAATDYGTDGSVIGANWVNSDLSNRWKISGDGLFLKARTMPAILYSTAQKTVSGNGTHFMVSADVSIGISNGWAGIVFNYQDPSNFYCLRIKGSTRDYQLLAKIAGTWTILASAANAAEPFELKTPYTLTISSEDACEFYFTIRKTEGSIILNPVANAVDSYSHFSNGYAGLYSPTAHMGTDPDAVFDNFRLEVSTAPPPKKLQFTDPAIPQPEYKVLEKIAVQPVWAATSVGFALETLGNRQFVVFYDANRQMVAGQRMLDSKDWTFQKLPSFLKWDSHNYIEIALDSEGYIHISGNMHVAPLVYFRSEKAYDVTSLKEINRMTGELETQCTYPKFFKGPKGELVFNYRDGSSGKGNQIYNVYDTGTQTWKRLLDQPLTDGQGLMNAYCNGPLLGPDGWFHITWVWRDTYLADSNHDLSYARSKDLFHWEAASGDPITLPIRLDTPSVVVDPVPVKGGMLNGNGQIGFDSQNRVVLAYHKFDANGKTQLYNARLENGKWKIYQTSDWDYRWYFSGGGSIINKISISSVEVAADGLCQGFSHKKEGSGRFLLDETTLKPKGMLRNKQWPDEIKTVHSTFPEMGVKTLLDRNSRSGYILRWETLPPFRDILRPEPWPAPSALEVYKVE